MPLRKYSDRQIIYGLAFGQVIGIVMLISLLIYTVRRWQQFDQAVAANAVNIRGIQEALQEVGIRPQAVPAPETKP